MNVENRQLVTDEWFKRHERLIWKAITQQYYSSNPDDMEDMFQDACLAIVEAAPKFNPEREAKMTTFMYTCVTNAVKMKIRAQKAASRGSGVKPYSLEGLADQKCEWAAQSPDADAWGRVYCQADFQANMLRDRRADVEADTILCMEMNHLLSRLKQSLEPIEYEILIGKCYGHSQDKIAEVVGVSQATVSTYLYTAQKKARVSLREAVS